MVDVFVRQTEAWSFVRSLEDPTERLLMEIALATALSFLLTDAEYGRTFAQAPMDLLMHARAMHAFLRKADVLRDVMSGKVTSVDDLDPFS